jgi:hypothetical protein
VVDKEAFHERYMFRAGVVGFIFLRKALVKGRKKDYIMKTLWMQEKKSMH